VVRTSDDTREEGSSRRGETQVDESLTTVVELLSHETRARILVTLAAHHAASPREPELSFSELRRAVGHDDPGNFNYHLGRLRGTLVEQTPDGYELSYVGGRFVGALLSGRFDPDADVPAVDGQTVCPLCGDPGRVTYEQGTLQVDCDAGHGARLNIGANVLAGRSVEAALNLAWLRSVVELRQAVEGLCPVCDGRMDGGIERPVDDEFPVYLFTCRRCGATFQTPPGGLVIDHPRVAALCHDHGIDPRRSAWTVLTDHVGEPRVVADDPPRVELVVTVEDDRLRLRLDENGRTLDRA
jgi:hypothetical protein